MSESQIICTGPINSEATRILSSYGRVVVVDDVSENTLLKMMPQAIALVVRGEGSITARLIECAPYLRVIGRSGSGYNNVDISAATKRGVPVVFTPGANATTVAEASITMMLTLAKHTFYWDGEVKSGRWSSRNNFRNIDLCDQTLGIIGFGAIGQALARIAAAFQMQIVAYDPYANPTAAESLGVALIELDALLERSRFICLHAAVNDETRGLINRQRLALCQPGAFLVNLARGDLIESLDCLYEAVENGTLAGVGLDVFSPEPPDIEHPLLSLEQCVTAPHALGMSQNTMDRIFRNMARDMKAILEGQPPKHVVNPTVLESIE